MMKTSKALQLLSQTMDMTAGLETVMFLDTTTPELQAEIGWFLDQPAEALEDGGRVVELVQALLEAGHETVAWLMASVVLEVSRG